MGAACPPCERQAGLSFQHCLPDPGQAALRPLCMKQYLYLVRFKQALLGFAGFSDSST